MEIYVIKTLATSKAVLQFVSASDGKVYEAIVLEQQP
jgi:hypothetical protein